MPRPSSLTSSTSVDRRSTRERDVHPGGAARGGRRWSASPAACGTRPWRKRRRGRHRSACTRTTAVTPVRRSNSCACHSIAATSPGRRGCWAEDRWRSGAPSRSSPSIRTMIDCTRSDHLGRSVHSALEPREVELEPGQRLAQLVMDLARDTGALLLPHELQPRRQRAQLRAGAPRLLVGLFPLRDVGGHREQARFSAHVDHLGGDRGGARPDPRGAGRRTRSPGPSPRAESPGRTSAAGRGRPTTPAPTRSARSPVRGKSRGRGGRCR